MERISEEILRVEEGSLYPALHHRMEEKGWIHAAWGVTETNCKARIYSLTAAGRKQLDAELVNWKRLSAGVGNWKRLSAGVGKVLSFA